MDCPFFFFFFNCITFILQLYYASEASKMANRESDESSTKSYMAPHVLAMSATPIPRTLALALYGDVSLTQVSRVS